MKNLIFKSSFHEKLKMLLVLLWVFLGSINQVWAWDAMVCRSTDGGLKATKTVGDKLNGSYSWDYTFTTNGGWSSGELKVLVGISTSYYKSVDGVWVSDDGNTNKNVKGDIGGVKFDRSGYWYAVGKYKTAYTTTNSSWTSNTTLSFGSNSEPYWKVNPPAVKSGTISVSATNTAAGSGTGLSSESPIILTSGSASRLTITATQNVSDANSALWCKFGSSGSYSSTTTYDIAANTLTSNQTLALKVKYRNNGANLDGAETSTTIYYRWEEAPAVVLTASKTSGIKVGETITLTATGSYASNITKYEFYEGSTKITTVSAPTNTYSYTPTTVGAKTMKVVMTYNSGSSTVTSANLALSLSTPSVSLAVKSGSSNEVYLGETTTIMKATPSNVGAGVTPSYVFTDQASPAVSSSSQTGTEWTYTPGKAGTKTMKVTMSVGGGTYTATATVYVYQHFTIHIKNTDGWSGMYVYMWNSSGNAGAFPGAQQTSYNGSSKWYNVVLDTKYTNFIINQGNNSKQSGDISMLAASNAGNCYTTTTGTSLPSTTCPSAPDVTTSAATSINLTSMTLNASSVGDNSDDITEYGFKYGTTSACSDGSVTASNLSSGSFSKQITGLNMGTKYYFKAYATNAQGTTYGSVLYATTTAASLTLTPTVNYEGRSVSIATSTNLDSDHGFSGTKYLYCSCSSKPAGAAAPTISYDGTTISISGASTDGQYIFAVSYRSASGGGGSAYVAKNCTITMRTIPDRSSLTINHAKYNSTYMTGDGANATPYFIYLKRASSYGKLNLSATLPAALLTGETLYYSVGGTEKGTVTVSGTAASVTMDLPDKSAGDKRSTTIKFYSKLDGQVAPAAKQASATVYYQVCANPVVTVSATYGETPIVSQQIPQNADVEVSASVTNIPGTPTFTYKKESGGTYTSTTTYTMDIQGANVVYAKTTYLGDNWEGSKTITTYAANAATLTTRKTDMYGDDVSTSVTRLFKNTGEEYTAPDIAGYTFSDWSCSNANVQVSDNSGSTWKSTSTNQTVYVKATATGGTLTAHYNENKRIYFDDRNTNWGSVYVYLFNNQVWHSTNGVQPKVNKIASAPMTRIGQSNIYYYEYSCSSSSIKYVAFSKHDQRTNNYLYATSAAYRGDFTECNPVYVPNATKEKRVNEVDYFNLGYWRRYMPTKAPYSIYMVSGGVYSNTDLGKFDPENASVDGESFKKELLLAANTTYTFNLPSSCGGTYGNNGTMTKDNNQNWTFEPTSDKIKNCKIQTTAEGTYVFRLSTADGQVKLSVDYPLNVGDYQIYYTDNTGNNNNYSNFIRKNTGISSKNDTVSFFVKKNSSPKYQVYRCSGFDGTTPTWATVGSATAISVAKDSVYNLIFQQPSGGASISKVGQEYYSGDYYVRTDGAAGGWANYLTNPDNKMKHTDKASALAAGYTYYYLRWIGDASGNSTANVKFVVATKYNDCVSQEFGDDPAEGSLSGGQYLTGKGANVRFTYHPGTNNMTRTCIGGSGHDVNYLVIDGTKLKKADNSAWSQSAMVDFNDWIYTLDLKAADDATITLKSHYNNKYVTVLPSEKVFDVNDALYYNLRVIYDYKTNEVVAAYIPSTVSKELEVDVDIMFIRKAKDNFEDAPPTTLALTGSGKITGAAKTLYGAIEFEKDYVRAEGEYSGLASRRPQRSTYWISFPFDVRIKDIFGLGEYTETWIIQRYRGDLRAQKGWFLETKTFWEYVMDENYVMKAGQGYALSIDCEAIEWPNNQTIQYLYFPSTEKVTDITTVLPKTSTNVPAYPCTITSPADRTIKDANWNVIGIPGFTTGWGKATATVQTIGGDFYYFYTWNPVGNVVTSASAKKYNFAFMHSYMVQYAGNINWTTSEPAAISARRAPEALPEEIEFCVHLMQGDDEADHTFITLLDNDKVTTGFDMNMDLVKMFNAKTANIYTLINGDVQSAANCVPMSTDQTTIVPLGVQIVTDGEYTFSIPEGTEGVGVTLIDNELQTRTNLALMDYAVTLPAGTYDERFVIEISPIEQTTTSVETVNGANGDAALNSVCKKLIDGVLYIVKDGKVFDARGARVQ